MKLNEAKYILESTGFTVKNTESSFDKAVSSLMESMEARNATGTKAYSILSEMARFRGKYVDSFAGLEDAGTVSLSVGRGGETKEFGVAEGASKVENDFKSANSKGCSQDAATRLAANFKTVLAAMPETANQAYVEELNKELNYINQCIDAGDGIPKGGWTAEGLARTTHSRDDSALDAKDLIKKINNSITSLKKGGKNYDLIKSRIDALAARSDELTAEENEKVMDLYTKLDIANEQGQTRAVSSGKIAIFKKNDGVADLRITAKLNHNGIPFTKNEDGTFTITKKVSEAKELLADYGTFVEPAAQSDSNEVYVSFNDDETAQIVLEDIGPAAGVELTATDAVSFLVNGTKAQVKKFFKDLDTNGVEYTISDAEPPQGETAAEADAEAEGEIEESFDYTLTQAGFLSRD